MNRQWNNKRAEMGVGTLIIFIALIVVAAVAATTMIGTTDNMRGQADSTGKASMDTVATKFVINKAVANTDPTISVVTSIDLYCRLAPGSGPVDLKYVTIMDSNVNLSYNAALNSHGIAVKGSHFGVDAVPSSEWDAEKQTIREGDLVVFTIDRSAAPLIPGSTVLIKIVPEYGSALSQTIIIPTDLDMEHVVIS
jgi:flagellin FlaB